jgi:hypothetical protein
MSDYADLSKTHPYRFYFKSTWLTKILRLFGKNIDTDHTGLLFKLSDLCDYKINPLYATSRFSKLTNIICFCESEILFDLWSDKKSKYAVDFPNLHRCLQHFSMVHGGSQYDKQYYYDIFRPLKRIFHRIIDSDIKNKPIKDSHALFRT